MHRQSLCIVQRSNLRCCIHVRVSVSRSFSSLKLLSHNTFARFPGGILNIYIWISVNGIATLPDNGGCTNEASPVSWYYIPYIFQAVYDLLVFLLCTIKVGLKLVPSASIVHIAYGPLPQIAATSTESIRDSIIPSRRKATKLYSEFLRGGVRLCRTLCAWITLTWI